MTQKEKVMDRAAKKLQKIHQVSGWILDHWKDFPDNLYQLINDEYFPFDMREFLSEMVRQDFANAITPAIGDNWRLLAEADGVLVLDEDEPGDDSA